MRLRTFKMPDATWDRLCERSSERGVSASELVRLLITDGLLADLPAEEKSSSGSPVVVRAAEKQSSGQRTPTGQTRAPSQTRARRSGVSGAPSPAPVLPGTGPWTGFRPVPKPSAAKKRGRA